MIYWAPLLHFYQPPTQVHWVLKKIYQESYRPLVDLFHELPYAEVTVDINGVLTEMLDDHGMSDIISGLRGLAEEGRLEFTGTAMYHPILPLIPQAEMLRQIVHNYQINRRFFGEAFSPKGFFPPEMGYGPEILNPIVETGHQWVILSGVACTVDWPLDVIHEISFVGNRLSVFFRDDTLSNRIAFHELDADGFIDNLRHLQGARRDVYVITAVDAETFGHHIRNWEELFLQEVYQALEPAGAGGPEEEALQRTMSAQRDVFAFKETAQKPEIQVVTISKLLELFRRGEPVDPRPSSWSTSMDDITAGNPYPLWQSKDNPIHQFQEQHVSIALDMIEKALELADTPPARQSADIARGLLDRALHSDQYWWASRKPWWDVNLVNRGLQQQDEVILNAYRAIRLSNASQNEKRECYYLVVAARDLRSKIVDQLFAY